MVGRLNCVLKNSPDETGKFLASVRPVLTALVAVLVFSFILIPQKSEGRIYAPKPPSSPHTRNARSATTWRTYAWIPGHWRWHRNRYDWVPGHYRRPPLGANRWIYGHWLQGHRGWFWIEGHCSD